MVEKKIYKKDFTPRLNTPSFEVLKCLQEGLNVTEISKYRNCSRVAIYGILKTLINKGLVRKIGYATYELTDKGMHGLHSFVALRYKLRQHNLHIKISVLESPKNWELKRNEIRQMPYFNKTIKLKNNEQELINFGKLLIKTTTKSMIIKIPTIYARNWEDAIIQAMGILEDSIPKLEHQFKVKLVKDYKSNIMIISQEYARIQDALAKLYRCEGNRIYLTGSDGKIWLITDLSFSTDELEFIHPNKATDDLDAIAPFLNDLRKNPITISKMREETKEVLEVAKASMQNEIKHQKVLDEILTAFKKINKRLDKAGL
jgi:predicted transcriptional regulator